MIETLQADGYKFASWDGTAFSLPNNRSGQTAAARAQVLGFDFPGSRELDPATIPRIAIGRLPVRRPLLGSVLLGCIPFVAGCFSVALWDRVYPMILGIPFNFFWLISWLFLTPICMWAAYRLETSRPPEPIANKAADSEP